MLDLNTVMLGTEDAKSLADFYAKFLGKPDYEDQGFFGWKAGSCFLMIMPHSEVKGQNEMPGRIIINFQTPDVKGEFERIKGLGVPVVQEPYQPGGAPAEMWLATFADLDGNYFQLATPMPEQ